MNQLQTILSHQCYLNNQLQSVFGHQSKTINIIRIIYTLIQHLCNQFVIQQIPPTVMIYLHFRSKIIDNLLYPNIILYHGMIKYSTLLIDILKEGLTSMVKLWNAMFIAFVAESNVCAALRCHVSFTASILFICRVEL